MKPIATIGLLIWIMFYGCYLLKQALQKRQGLRADIMGHGVKPAELLARERRLKLVTYAMAAAQLASLAFDDRIPLLLAAPAARWAGLGLMLLGTGFFLAAMSTMGRSWRAGIDTTGDTALITTGVYRISRNPAFLGFDLLYIGSALAICNVVLVVFCILAILALHRQILDEESALPALFGADYKRYRQQVGRYFWRL